MSYEGYVRLLCESGHQDVYDCYAVRPDKCRCGARFVWERHVDQTNDDGVDPELEMLTPPVVERCNLGHSHVIVEPTFRKPYGL